MARILTDADLYGDVSEPVLGAGLRRRLDRMDAHADEAERFVEAQFGDGRRRRTVLATVARHKCPAVYCSTCERFVVRRMTAEERLERDRVGRAILAEG